MVVSMRVSRVSWLASLAWVVLLGTARLESGLDTRSSISTSVWGLGADYDPPTIATGRVGFDEARRRTQPHRSGDREQIGMPALPRKCSQSCKSCQEVPRYPANEVRG